VFPGVGFDGLPFDFAVMVEAVAAVWWCYERATIRCMVYVCYVL
jgi:hypothetical protein